jgi:hypothetical protein
VAAAWRHLVELAERMAGARLPAWRAAELIAAEAWSGAARPAVPGVDPDSTRETACDDTHEAASDGARDALAARRATHDPNETTCAFGAVDWSLIREAIPDHVTALAHDVAALDPVALDTRLRTVVAEMRGIDWRLGRLLRLCFDLRLYLLMGFTSASHFVRERLGISTRKARMLVAVERHTWRAPAVLDAYRDGRVSALQVLTLAPLLEDRVAAAWLRRAGEVTLRRLADEVGWALDIRDAARAWGAIAPPPARAPLDPPARQMRAPGSWEECLSEVTFVGPASVIALFRDAIAASRQPAEPEWRAFERLLDEVCRDWESQPRHRDPIFARDGWRCAVPACSARRDLHDHHIVWRSREGSNAQPNRVAVCVQHHQQCIHRNFVSASGDAPDAIRWQLGTRRGHRPFLELIGDYYVADAEGGVTAA